MQEGPQTWHHGLVAAWWGEFNDDFRPHEIPFYRAHIDRSGQPVLDAGVEQEGCCCPISGQDSTWMAVTSRRT